VGQPKARERLSDILNESFRIIYIRVDTGGSGWRTRFYLIELELVSDILHDFRGDWPLLFDVCIDERMFTK
jgi:hypothetical protein